MESIKILNTRVDIVSKQEVLHKIKDLLGANETGKQLVTTNPEFILEAEKNQQFRDIINSSWISVCDGYGIRLAAKYLNEISNEKNSFFKKISTAIKVIFYGFFCSHKLDTVTQVISGSDLLGDIVQDIPKQGTKQANIFLLGGFGKTPEQVAEKMNQKFGSKGNLKFSFSVFEKPDILEQINEAQTVILFVAINHPKAQIWIDQNLPRLPSVKLAIGVGGAFDYYSGKVERAPKVWQGKFEWLYRLIKQPKKRFKRIFQAVIVFPLKVFTKS